MSEDQLDRMLPRVEEAGGFEEASTDGLWRIWRLMWARRSDIEGRFLHVVMLFILMPSLFVGYLAIGRFSAIRGVTVWSPATNLDAIMPTIPLFLIPYYGFFLLYPAMVMLSPRTDHGRRHLMLVFQSLTIASLTSFTVFLTLPAEITRFGLDAISLQEVSSFERLLITPIIAFDRPYNAWPSIHAAHGTLLLLSIGSLARSGGLTIRLTSGENRFLEPVLIGVWAVLIASTILTSQHFIFDALTGITLAAVIWMAALGHQLDPADH